MKLTRPDIAAYLLTGLAIIAVTLLSALHVAIPDYLTTAGMVALGIGGGASLPRGASTETAAAEPAPVVIPTQTTVADAPVATHAPA